MSQRRAAWIDFSTGTLEETEKAGNPSGKNVDVEGDLEPQLAVTLDLRERQVQR